MSKNEPGSREPLHTILQAIIADKEKEVALLANKIAFNDGVNGEFCRNSLVDKVTGGFTVIAEVKRSSPSQGVIRRDFDPVAIAGSYKANGAQAISVLTERNYFHGDISHLSQVKRTCGLPVLRKDFIIDCRQIKESMDAGADCILLIAACLQGNNLAELHEKAVVAGLEVLVEVHTEEEVEQAVAIKPSLIGINNRNLHTFSMDMSTSLRLIKMIPNHIPVICESGISNHDDILLLKKAGFSGILVGTSLLRQEDPGLALRRLLNG